jgi:hypothetical protein
MVLGTTEERLTISIKIGCYERRQTNPVIMQESCTRHYMNYCNRYEFKLILVEKKENDRPVRIVHSNGLLSLQHSGFVRHHTGFMKRRLPVEK